MNAYLFILQNVKLVKKMNADMGNTAKDLIANLTILQNGKYANMELSAMDVIEHILKDMLILANMAKIANVKNVISDIRKLIN